MNHETCNVKTDVSCSHHANVIESQIAKFLYPQNCHYYVDVHYQSKGLNSQLKNVNQQVLQGKNKSTFFESNYVQAQVFIDARI